MFKRSQSGVGFATGFGLVSREERRRADRFFADLVGIPSVPSRPRGAGVAPLGWGRAAEASELAAENWIPEPTVPPRAPGGLGGRAFMQTIWGEREPSGADWLRREQAMVAELLAGNMPSWLRRWVTVEVRRESPRVTVRVLPDYLCVGDDNDYRHVPLDQHSAQKVADAFVACLPTAKICHAIYMQTPENQRIGAIPRDYSVTPWTKRRLIRESWAQNSTAAYEEHSRAIQARMSDPQVQVQPGQLIAGHKKDVVVANRLHSAPKKIAFHGFYDRKGFPFEPCYEVKGGPLPGCNKENPTLAHPSGRFSDYSQGVRLMHPIMHIDGAMKLVSEVLTDKELSRLISTEGPIVPPRIPTPSKGKAAAAASSRESANGDCGCGGHGAAAEIPMNAWTGESILPLLPPPRLPRPYGRELRARAWRFRCAPDPPTVSPASFLPTAIGDGERAVRAALERAGADAAGIDRFKRAGGVDPLLPIALALGDLCLGEIVARLRYPAEHLLNPPHGLGAAGPAAVGARTRPELLAPRVLLAIPGHFRELARRAPGVPEAFALENLGWRLALLLRDRVNQATRKSWFVPTPPPWTTPFPSQLPGYSADVAALIRSIPELLDGELSAQGFGEREAQWRDGLAGRQWSLETGTSVDPSTGQANPGLPFYATGGAAVPALPLDEARRVVARLSQAWNAISGDRGEIRPQFDREMAPAKLGSLELSSAYPRLRTARSLVPSVPVLRPLAPVFEALFRTIRELGWNDLAFQTGGVYVFRAVRGTTNSISNHALGLAIDVNTHENPRVESPPTPWAPGWSAMDPRIVALFDAFGFRWGRSIRPKSDPMHFELWLRPEPQPTC